MTRTFASWLRGYPATFMALAVSTLVWASAALGGPDAFLGWRDWSARFTRLEIDALAVAFVLCAGGLVIDLRRKERRHLRLHLRGTRRQRAFLDLIPDHIYRVGRSGTIVDYKGRPEAPTLDGGAGADDSVLTPDALDTCLALLDEARRTSTVQVFEYQRDEGDAVADYEARVLAADDTGEAFLVVRDVSERKQVERLKQGFVSVVSHELRTPLTSMHGSLGLLAGRLADELPSRSRELVEVAHRNSERLVRLVNDIVDVQRIGVGGVRLALGPVEVDPLLVRAIEQHRDAAARAGVTLRLIGRTGGAKVEADAERLAQVMDHLLSNAVKFSRDGGQVDVVAHRTEGRVQVAVRDRGAGVPASFRARIFDAFSLADTSSRRPTEGSGLGLNLARALIEQMRGRLDFRSEVGAGSTFFFELPMAEEAGEDGVEDGTEGGRYRSVG